MNFDHISVLMEESIRSLKIKEDGIYVDGTLGGGGHSLRILESLTSGRLVGIDQDDNAIKKAREVLKDHKDKLTIVKGNYFNIDDILDKLEIDKIDGMILDIGVSSHQLDEEDRGFSYNKDAPLDMRMDQNSNFSAWNVVNEYSLEELDRVLFDYGEERWAKRISEFIVAEREKAPINTTLELVDIIKKAIPKKVRQDMKHPGRRTFQGIRIEVNKELDVLEGAIPKIVNRLNKGGRLSIITFHSLEDRIVKNVFRDLNTSCICPIELPFCSCDKEKEIKIITRKPIVPSPEEVDRNPRARSSKLRVAEKI